MTDQIADAEARGYARAVAALRDDDLYRNWWCATAERPADPYWSPTNRRHLADFLETIGPDGIDVTKPVDDQYAWAFRDTRDGHIEPCRDRREAEFMIGGRRRIYGRVDVLLRRRWAGQWEEVSDGG